MNIFGSNPQRLLDLGHKVALFMIAASLATIPLVGILIYLGNRVVASGESKCDEQGSRDSKRRFWFVAVLLPVIFAVLYIALDPSLILRLYGTVRKPPFGNSQEVQVWASQRSGLYYCPGTRLYGKLQPGKNMSERSALQSGFQPSLGQMCH
jgi:hypothetical protein